MSVEVDFAQFNQVSQPAGSQVEWVHTWPGVFDNNHYYGVSFIADSNPSNLQLVSLSYSRDPDGTVHIHTVVQNNGPDVAMSFKFIQAPSEF